MRCGGVWWLIHCQLVCIFKASILTQKPTHWPVAGLIPSTRNVVTLQHVPWVWLRGVDCFEGGEPLEKKTLTKVNGIWRWGKKLSWSVSLTPQMKIGRYFVGLFGSFLASYNCSIGRLRSSCWVLTKYRHSETSDYNPWVKRPKLSQFLTLRGDGPCHPSCKMELGSNRKMLLLAIVGTNCILSEARSSKPYKYGVNWALFVVCVSQLLFGGVTTLREFYAATSFQLMLFLTSYTHRPASDSDISKILNIFDLSYGQEQEAC